MTAMLPNPFENIDLTGARQRETAAGVSAGAPASVAVENPVAPVNATPGSTAAAEHRPPVSVVAAIPDPLVIPEFLRRVA
jgi:hypothetical protein